MTEQDLLDRLAAYRPQPTHFVGDWNPAAARAAALSAADDRTLRWRPRLRVSPAVLSAAAILALLAGVVVAVVLPGDGRVRAASRPFVAAELIATPRVGAGQFSARELTVTGTDGSGSAQHGWVYAAPDGGLWYSGNISAAGCVHFPAREAPNTTQPSQAWFDAMPTTADALKSYLGSRVEGSSSADEALFVSVGDMLRNTDLLATSPLRAAMVGMLSTLGGVTVHTGVADDSGRPAVRVDWMNQALRPGDVSSLYFDSSTFQLLEEREGPSGAPQTYDGPSPAYTAGATDGASDAQLQAASDTSIMGVEKVVDRVPADVASCPAG